jgi:hypothetical protein
MAWSTKIYAKVALKKTHGGMNVLLALDQALEAIRKTDKIDNPTLGIPKIVYGVGWPYDGHDSAAVLPANGSLVCPEPAPPAVD